MSFIKAQKIVRDIHGAIVSGSASLVDAVYDKGQTSGHSRQVVREKLGKVLRLSENHKSGLFLSPTRGLVEYDADKDEFTPVDSTDARLPRNRLFQTPERHTVFGDSYFLMLFLKKCGMLDVLRSVFQKKEGLERVLAHVLHGVLKDGSRISCDAFLEKSFASYLLPDLPYASLKSDTFFFTALGDDRARVSFFKAFVAMMRRSYPDFGRGCYVDSTPLPNDIRNNPFNALCSHGVNATAVMMRLVLVLDEATGLPVWFDLIPGNVLDVNTIMTTVNDVASTLDIEIESLVLDAGYASKELVQTFHIGTEKTLICRMPARRGFPHKELYWAVKNLINKGKYSFVNSGHGYFGCRKEIKLFGQSMYAYVYVDKDNALKRSSDYIVEHEEEFDSLKQYEKDWIMVRFGYFVLLSNIRTTPAELLLQYFARIDIEHAFKTGKEYLNLLPLSKWNDQTVRGKILHDMVNMIVLLMLRKEFDVSGYSISELFGRCQSLMCFRDKEDNVIVETASKQVKEYFKMFDFNVPSRIKLKRFANEILGSSV